MAEQWQGHLCHPLQTKIDTWFSFFFVHTAIKTTYNGFTISTISLNLIICFFVFWDTEPTTLFRKYCGQVQTKIMTAQTVLKKKKQYCAHLNKLWT